MARRAAVLVGMALVLAGIVTAGVHNLHARRAAMEANHVQLIPASGSADAAAPDGQGANLIGKAAPAFTLVGVDGKKVSLSQYKGRPVVVNFWATWCGPCKLEMPWFQEFYSKYSPNGLVILGLSQDADTAPAEVAGAAKKIGVSYPILMPDETVARAYGGVDYLPETFYVDRSGKVTAVTAGVPNKEEMEARIQQAMGTTPATAGGM